MFIESPKPHLFQINWEVISLILKNLHLLNLQACNIALIVTDGKSNVEERGTLPESLAAKNKGITVYSVGVTSGANEEEVREISSNPRQLNHNYYMLNGFSDLRDIVDDITTQACRPLYGK